MKIKLITIVGLFMVVGFASCVKQANYPDRPIISYNSYVIGANNGLTLKIDFTDGNGAIGYPTSDANSPYDCYLEYLIKDASGAFVPVSVAGQNDPVMGDTLFFGYHIPDLTPTSGNKELSGQIQIQLQTWYETKNASIKFVIWVIDRAGQKSNRITTPAITTPNS